MYFYFFFRKPLRKQLESIAEDKPIDFHPERGMNGINIGSSQNTSDDNTTFPDENAQEDPNEDNR